MQLIAPDLDYQSNAPLYGQLYHYLKQAILSGGISSKEKLPSLRSLSKQLGLSITTVHLAYSQLLTEGYVLSKPQSGYYVCNVLTEQGKAPTKKNPGASTEQYLLYSSSQLDDSTSPTPYFDPACFDFLKWKKCMNTVLTDYSDLLLLEGDPRGEAPLRHEISDYLYRARGVRTTPEQIVIGAGTQQLTGSLCMILSRMSIDYVAFEEPGYLPVRDIFQARGFKMTSVPVEKDGIKIEKLPANIKSAVYVSPSNQFPTGSIMPIGRRYALLEWAKENKSIIIEDDYNSELRYFGKAVPSLQGLDEEESVVYLGSFSSTLFPSVKISYMVLPTPMEQLFEDILGGYTQTCSKTEQLTLALYMQKGLYQTNIKKLRTLYAQKMQIATAGLKKYAKDQVQVLSNTSGLHMLLRVLLPQSTTPEALCQKAATLGLIAGYVPYSNREQDPGNQTATLIFYYTRVPLAQMEKAIKDFSKLLLPHP